LSGEINLKTNGSKTKNPDTTARVFEEH
jgi:hypothetical protein